MKKVKPGDSLNIPAATYNTFIDAAEDFKMRTGALKAGRQNRIPLNQTILIENNSDSDVDQFKPLGIDSSLFSLSDDVRKFADNLLLGCVALTKEHAEKLVITAEPIKSGAIGRAYPTGVCLSYVYIADTSHGYATADSNRLSSSIIGPAAILWKSGTYGTQLCLIRFCNIPPAVSIFPAKIFGESNGSYSWIEMAPTSATEVWVGKSGGRSNTSTGKMATEFNGIIGLYNADVTINNKTVTVGASTSFVVEMHELTANDGTKFYRFYSPFAPFSKYRFDIPTYNRSTTSGGGIAVAEQLRAHA